MQAANGKAGSSKGRTAAGTHGATSLLVDGRHATTRTVGWKPSCRCDGTDIRPAVVLDPFSGSGTTAEVCLKYGRQFLGCEINGEYIELAKQRVLAAEKRFGTPLFKQGQAEAAGVESGMPAEKGVPHAE
ncbi:MAG: site-specific DNA-methyltransferase [Micavibrio sp.]|nr:site-specific DNA-methyltransferase [Micavibrio sp.]